MRLSPAGHQPSISCSWGVLLLLLLLLLLLILSSPSSFVSSSILFAKVCIVLYPLIFPFFSFFMPQVKDQQSYSLHLILAYFIFVTTIFS